MEQEAVEEQKEQVQEKTSEKTPSKSPKKTTKITRMVMQGFKSFAKHTELQFGDTFNCILGPNGAGKSNVLDSLCFVLGKSSAKGLRAESSSNLVYNGGKVKKAAKQGEVSIFFDNTSRLFPLDVDEIKVTRIVKDSGQSIYRINDEKKTRREILELLNYAKINPDGYNIILQGDIVRFVEMPPVERRQLIEDISGISLYEEKKQKAMSELDKVEQSLRETDIILKERESYLKELKKDRDQALKYKEMNDKVKENKASYLKLQIDRKGGEEKDFFEKEKKTQDEIKSLQEKIEQLKKSIQEKETEVQSINKEIEEKGEVEQINLNKQVESLKIDVTKLNSRQETVNQEIGKIDQRRTDLSSSLGDIEQKIKQLETEKKEAKESHEKKSKELEDIKKKIVAFKEKNNLDDIGNIETQIEQIDKNTEEIQKEVHTQREKQHDLVRQKDKIAHELALIDDRMQKVAEVEKEHKKQLDEINTKRQEFKTATLELNKRLDDDSQYGARLSKLRRDIQDSSEDLSKLKAKNISIQETTRGDLAIRKILELKKQKTGIYGSIADLGNVSSKYALALEICASNRIKSIVVDTDKTAAECIRYLKSQKLGTASFMPLNKITPRERNKDLAKVAKGPGSHGFAIDLIEFDPKFKNAFSYVFENTLIIDSIDVAVKLGVNKAKFVTIDGDISERSGMMQGGFRQRKREAMGFKEKELTKKIEKLEAEIGENQAAIDVYEKKRLENEETITTLRTKKAELEGEIIKAEKALHLDDKDLGASAEKKKELEKEEEAVEKSINELINTISEKNRALAQDKIEKQKLRSAITQLNNPRLVAELNAFEQKQHELKDEIIRLEADSKNTERLLNDISSPEYEKIKKLLKQIDKEETDFKQEAQTIKESIKEKNADLKEKEKAAAEFYAKFKNLFARANKIKDEISKETLSLEKKKDESRQTEIKLNTLSLKKAEMTAGLSALQDEFAQYEGVPLRTDLSEQELKNEIAKFERMRENIGSVNMRALDIYDEVETQYKELMSKQENLSKEREDVIALMEEIEGKKKELFMETFTAVNDVFKEFFTMLTTKGAQATLVVEDPENPFEAGVRVNVKISGSKFLDIRSLSGGEKTMTALAFIFAIQEHDPASFYVLDEVDAALDKHNAERLASMVKKYSDRAQYIIISHNDGVISAADNLYGVSMNEHGISQVVSLKV